MTHLPPDWFDVDDGNAFEDELRTECGPGHPLFGRQLEAIARRFDRDDVLFRVSDSDAVAQVHLTWTGVREPSPKWPTTQLFKSVDDWAAGAAGEEGAG